ncbi:MULTISPECIES: beta-glucosidase BglX [Sphingobacterium]|uniref:beta-glucosidase n=1 Tax=Sphingobacterium populi TaxID=1812824 RepID=A0ABW5UIN0_9SPHI|nr:beta-glucosidase BglX [Sphingobacterium sp. CFCC 11742]
MNRSKFGLIICALALPFLAQAQQNDRKMNQFLDDLMSKMTLQEKIGQLNLVTAGEAVTGSVVSTGVEQKIAEGKIGGIFSLSTPEKTRRAQEIAMKQSRLKIPIIFGMDVIHGYRTAFPIPLGLAASWDLDLIQQTARIAAKEATADGIHWAFSPMVDISRDARWGRISEGSGEDPYLGSLIAAAMVRGLQSDDLRAKDAMLACVKHFALYGAAESGRDYNTTDMSLHRMYNEYFPPYKAAVDAGVGSVMVSFNDINGVPASANKWLLTDVLRQDWGFKGLVVSDYTGVNELVEHGLGDLQEVSKLSLNAGMDMDMVGEGFLTTLEKSVQEGKVKQERIDAACRAVLEAKYRLGLFDDPYKNTDSKRAKTDIYTPAHLQKAREAATKSFVLLKNENQLLPLKKQGKVAVIGPLANTGSNMPGTWSVSADHANTPSLVEGMRAALGNKVEIITHLGSNLLEDAAYQERATMFGRTIPRDERDEEAILAEAIAATSDVDVIVAALGEASEMSGESSSRVDIGIPAIQQRLLKKLLATGKPVVLVLFAGRPMTIVGESESVPAILNVWFGGSETGKAVADVLFGDVNPSGKLPASFPKHVGQLPLYYAHKNTGRPLAKGQWFEKFRSNYIDVDNEPLYPFGFGLSYTQFDYGQPQLSATSMTADGKIEVQIDVTNSGNWDGEEVVQLYIRDLVGSVTRPVKELKKFEKVLIKKGETKKISFTLQEEDLKFFNQELHWVAEPGEFEVFVGTNSRDTQVAKFTLNQ